MPISAGLPSARVNTKALRYGATEYCECTSQLVWTLTRSELACTAPLASNKATAENWNFMADSLAAMT